jgi:hypothetical protein
MVDRHRRPAREGDPEHHEVLQDVDPVDRPEGRGQDAEERQLRQRDGEQEEVGRAAAAGRVGLSGSHAGV